LLIDFYGTVAAGDADVVEAVCGRVVSEHGLALSAHELVVAWGDRFFAAIEVSNHERFRTLYQCECDSLVETVEPLIGPIDPRPFVDQLTAYWSGPKLHEESRSVLESLGLPVCCVSNADTADVLAAVELHGLRFDRVITSEDARCYKPHPAIFFKALRELNLAPEEVLHVGDSLHSDVGGAANAGIEALWICRDRRIYDIRQTEHDHKISSLNELQPFLESA